MQNSISKMDLIQKTINARIGVLNKLFSYKVEVTLNTSTLGQFHIIGNTFLTKFENGIQTLACIELDTVKEHPYTITLTVDQTTNQLIHPENGVHIWFRRLVQSPRGNSVCWERRPAYLEDIEEMDSNTIDNGVAEELYDIAFGR